MAQPLQCRWGVIECGPSATRFVTDVKAAGQNKGSLPIQHSFSAVASSSSDAARAFLDTHFSDLAPSPTPSSSSAAPAPATASYPMPKALTPSELYTSPTIDAIFIDSQSPELRSHADAALQAGKAVLIVRPLDLEAQEARSLVQIAKAKKTWLGILMKESRKDKASLRWSADEAARCRERSLLESPQIAWDDNFAILEALDEYRRLGVLPARGALPTPSQPSQVSAPSVPAQSQEQQSQSHVPTIEGAPVEATLTDADLAARRYPKSPRPSTPLPALEEAPETENSTSSSSVIDQGLTNGIGLGIPMNGGPSASSERSSSPSGVDVDVDVEGGTASLKAQIQELKHMLRQKNVQIGALEQSRDALSAGSPPTLAAGGAKGKSAVRISLPPQGYSVTAPVRPARRRNSSNVSSSSRTPNSSPLLAQKPLPGPGQAPARRRRESGIDHLSSADGTAARERKTSQGSASGGRDSPAARFLAPTIASEKRRIANLTQQANGIANRSVSADSTAGSEHADKGSNAAGTTSKVISQLTLELEYTQSQLDSTRSQLTTAQRNWTNLQKSYDAAKESLYQAKLESDRHSTAVARKERQYTEAVDRARRAETEAKDLGRASREWGTRVRQVESELGEVRRQQAKAEAGYEAITSAWKRTRQHWEDEVKSLRKQLEDVIKEHRDKARSALDKFGKVEHEWKGREGERKGLEAVLEGLRQERAKARTEVVKHVDDLVARLEVHEAQRQGQNAQVEEVQTELKRILRLMHAGVTDPETIQKEARVQ